MEMKLEDVLRALKEKKITPGEARSRLEEIKKRSQAPVSPEVKPGKEGKVAIIGMAGRFPKARDLDEYWKVLAGGVDCISEIPSSRWPLEDYFDPDPRTPGKSYSKWMGILEDMDKFDPLFFNISPLEAEFMDPQQRVFLECCWHAIEDGGIKPSSLGNRKCGVFVGCTMSDYKWLSDQGDLNAYSMIGMHSSILSARISYFLDLKGPCVAFDTACSSSLVAIANACDSLLLGSSDLALAGGVAVLGGPQIHIMTSKMDVLARGPRCYPFDTRADGYIPGEGVGVLLLKRLEEAERDKDNIYGVISGWGINQDGRTNGITAPSARSQMALEQEIYERFGINPETITMVEAHGTGTKLGDPLEVEGLVSAFRKFTEKKNYCALGSVKSNVGHLMTAAGASGVIKVLLSMKHKTLPPTINFEKLNEHINLEGTPFYINDTLKPWETAPGEKRRGTVSAFGFSGTNAHVVLDEYIPSLHQASFSVNGPYLLLLSAKSRDQLKIYAERILAYLGSPECGEPASVCYTSQVCREVMDFRLAVPGNSLEELKNGLREFLEERGDGRFFRGEGLLKNSGYKPGPGESREELGRLWSSGEMIDWSLIYGEQKPPEVRLPLYPFAREKYWVRKKSQVLVSRGLHPLVHRNSSCVKELRFTSHFSGKEFFFADHKVQGQGILPGVAYLEMARAAAAMAFEHSEKECRGIVLKDVVWARPIAPGAEGMDVHIALVPGSGESLSFEVYSRNEDGEVFLHSQGQAVPGGPGKGKERDLEELRNRNWGKEISSGEYYKDFEKRGIEYGPGHRGIKKLYTGNGCTLAWLEMPREVIEDEGDYVLHPSMLDSALQAVKTLMKLNDDGKVILPFSVDEVRIHNRCSAVMWALVRPDEGDENKFDAELYDNAGSLCVEVKGLSLRVIESEKAAALRSGFSENQILEMVKSGELDINYADELLKAIIDKR